MYNREANRYPHSPTCSCAECSRKRLSFSPGKSKPQPYNAKKPKKKAKHTKIHSGDWSRLMQAIKPKDARQPGDLPAKLGQPRQRSAELGERQTLPPALLKKCPACNELSLVLNDSGNLYECRRCGGSFFPAAIDKADEKLE